MGRFTLCVCVTRWNSGVFDHLTLRRSVLPHHPSAQPAGLRRPFPPTHSPLFTHNSSDITNSRCGYDLFHLKATETCCTLLETCTFCAISVISRSHNLAVMYSVRKIQRISNASINISNTLTGKCCIHYLNVANIQLSPVSSEITE